MSATAKLNAQQQRLASDNWDVTQAWAHRLAADHGLDADECVSAAAVGLCRASATFDSSRMRPEDFRKWATFKTKGAIMDLVARQNPVFGDTRKSHGNHMPTAIREADAGGNTRDDDPEPADASDGWNPADRSDNSPDGWLAVLRESTDNIRRSFTEAGTAQGRRGALVVEAATANIGLAAVDAIRAVRQRIDAINLGFVADFEKELAALDEAVNKAHRLGRMPAVLIGLSATAVEAVETVAVLAERVEAAAGAVAKEPRDHRGRPRTATTTTDN